MTVRDILHQETSRFFISIKIQMFTIFPIGVGAQSTLGGGTKFLPEKYILKISKMPEFYMILARKIIKVPEFV